jgi:hypothetical protein
MRDIKSRQGLVRSILEDEEAETVSFVATTTMDVPASVLARRIAENIKFSLNDFRAQNNGDEAFAYLREQIEGAGVFVLLLGNLGSYHTNIPLEIFRGFAVADKLSPMIVINDQDARTAWSFTALHEVVHLWLGTTGISGADVGAQIEQYCNDVAVGIRLKEDVPDRHSSHCLVGHQIQKFHERRSRRRQIMVSLLSEPKAFSEIRAEPAHHPISPGNLQLRVGC